VDDGGLVDRPPVVQLEDRRQPERVQLPERRALRFVLGHQRLVWDFLFGENDANLPAKGESIEIVQLEHGLLLEWERAALSGTAVGFLNLSPGPRIPAAAYFLISSSSTLNTSVAPGGTTPPIPRSP